MALHSWNLQKAVYTRLTGDATLMALITGVYDDVPEDSTYPYCVIGEESAINSGTKTVDAVEHSLSLHVWSRYRGLYEIKTIMERIYTLLHDYDLSVTDVSFINLRQEFETTIVDADGITRHGIIRFRAVVFD